MINGNPDVKAGRCPYCHGHGWLTASDGTTLPCDDCCGVGTLAAMWDHQLEEFNAQRQTPGVLS
jgi:hypothetical protein